MVALSYGTCLATVNLLNHSKNWVKVLRKNTHILIMLKKYYINGKFVAKHVCSFGMKRFRVCRIMQQCHKLGGQQELNQG